MRSGLDATPLCQNRPDARALIIVPTLNERENLPILIQQLGALNLGLDLLIVDDDSPDGTGLVADQWAARHGWIRVIHRSGQRGLGSAYVTGFTRALEEDYDVIGQMDADLSHNPKFLIPMLGELETADFVLGSRYVPGGGVRGWGVVRKAMSRSANLYARLTLAVAIRDLTSGFRLFRRAVLERLSLGTIRSNGYSFMIETTYRALRCGYKATELPIVFEDRKAGKSKLGIGVIAEAAVMVPLLRLRG